MLAYVGMTHLGLVSSACAAEKGFDVICFDVDEPPTIVEPQLDELLKKNHSRMTFTKDPNALKKCDLIYISPDVSTNDQGESDLTKITALLNIVYEVAKKDATIVILSQVPPGFTSQVKWPHVVYQVETLIFGRAVERALFPERFILGVKDQIPKTLLTYLQSFDCPILPMRYESAELTKIAINMYLASTVTTTNTLANLCEEIGANWSEMIPALKLDRRIGPYAYLDPGLGLSGGNIERDLATFSRFAAAYGTEASVVHAWQKNSRYRSDWALRVLHEHPASVVTVLGLAYKKDTHSIKNSPALKLILALSSSIRVYDPVVKKLPQEFSHVYCADSAIDACQGSDVVVVMTPWDEFKQIEIKNQRVIDPFGIIKCPQSHQLGVKACC